MAPAMVITPTSTAIADRPADGHDVGVGRFGAHCFGRKDPGREYWTLTVSSFHENLLTKVAPIGRRRNSLCARVDERLRQSDLTLGTTPGGRAGTTYERARRPVHDRRRFPPSTCWPRHRTPRPNDAPLSAGGTAERHRGLIGERMACGESPRSR